MPHEEVNQSSGLQIVVNGLPWAWTWKELKELFVDTGAIERADVVYGRDGRRWEQHAGGCSVWGGGVRGRAVSCGAGKGVPRQHRCWCGAWVGGCYQHAEYDAGVAASCLPSPSPTLPLLCPPPPAAAAAAVAMAPCATRLRRRPPLPSSSSTATTWRAAACRSSSTSLHERRRRASLGPGSHQCL